MLNHAGTNRIEFNIALAGQQIAFLLYQTGAETPFPQSAATPIGAIHILHIALPQRLHQRAHTVGGWRRHQHMHMVGHQDISVNPATGLVGVFFQPVEIEAEIFIGNKADLPVVAPLDQMQRDTGEHQARAAGHQKTTG